jgi:GNAT superfamily N-acetyltransferase
MRTHIEASKILEYLKQHRSYNAKEEKERLLSLLKDQNIHIIFNENQQMIGVIEVDRWNHFVYGPSAAIVISYDQTLGANSYAQAMLASVIENLQKEGVVMLMAMVNDKTINIINLFYHFGFSDWYGYVFKKHNKQPLPSCNLTKRQIEATDFDLYCKVMGECFVPMRAAVDIPPYNVIEQLWATKQEKEKTFKEWLEHKHSTWMYYDHDRWVGSGLLTNEDIDDVFINPDLQGKGYGRQIIYDLVETAYSRDIVPYIGHVKWNERAGILYDSCGFETYLSVSHLRLFLNNNFNK